MRRTSKKLKSQGWELRDVLNLVFTVMLVADLVVLGVDEVNTRNRNIDYVAMGRVEVERMKLEIARTAQSRIDSQTRPVFVAQMDTTQYSKPRKVMAQRSVYPTQLAGAGTIHPTTDQRSPYSKRSAILAKAEQTRAAAYSRSNYLVPTPKLPLIFGNFPPGTFTKQEETVLASIKKDLFDAVGGEAVFKQPTTYAPKIKALNEAIAKARQRVYLAFGQSALIASGY